MANNRNDMKDRVIPVSKDGGKKPEQTPQIQTIIRHKVPQPFMRWIVFIILMNICVNLLYTTTMLEVKNDGWDYFFRIAPNVFNFASLMFVGIVNSMIKEQNKQ